MILVVMLWHRVQRSNAVALPAAPSCLALRVASYSKCLDSVTCTFTEVHTRQPANESIENVKPDTLKAGFRDLSD